MPRLQDRLKKREVPTRIEVIPAGVSPVAGDVSVIASGMVMDATARRRWLGALALVGALALLVAGETVLKGRLGDLAFLFYWLVCLGLTCLAILAAILDVRSLQRHARQEQHELLDDTIKRIQSDAKARNRPNNQDRPRQPRR